MKDLQKIREEFPIFERRFSGHPLAYLDNAATVQKPRVVLRTMSDFYEKHYANVNRASYDLSHEASSLYKEARERVARFIGAGPREIVFLRNATEAINTVAQSWGEENIGEGDTILLSEMEHHANIVPWYLLAKKKEANLRWLSLTTDGEINMGDYQEALRSEPKIVAFTHVSNVLGTRNPVDEMIGLAHKAGAKVLIDGAQAASRIPLDVNQMDADFYVFSGHKVYGPTGIGVLYGKKGILSNMFPSEGGGGMISKVTKDEITFASPPARFEAGTPPIAEAIGLAAALDWLEGIGIEEIAVHEQELTNLLLSALREKENVLLPGLKGREGIVSFALQGIHSHDTAEVLNRFGLALRAGHHCAQPLIDSLGVSALVRASFAAYNTEEEVERLLLGIGEVERIFS